MSVTHTYTHIYTYTHTHTQVTLMTPFHSELFPECLALASEGGLMIGTVEDIQKLQIQTVPLGEYIHTYTHTHTYKHT